ncbi:MAG TPA: prolyl oligopeptidase family serine peptidase [Phycisphaerae bacterium]|nr:prolyl oligopeptidase family serine peptidase [Phycisphaerae bacterium]HOJ73840.1 prolyl oligopeptidase family serine peptidase [Phycisphaerae bacterium]HOM50781.1 prolyl oligopeptidase family serine peptidase [Phycisphaerae bacterium]HON65157.1 prolyl oligopeptidase family serine peptidase [Phycisphaerae bacterium]HOQ85818.1 prolyl oligopeptidase family serine peptidase [Phycisphaerae bacterium]
MNPALRRYERQITRTVAIDYWLYLPRDYERESQPWPLMLFLHGRGERGDLERAKKHGPPKRVAEGTDFPFLIVAPCCPADEWWQPDVLELLLEEICASYRVDPDRVYGTGLSMGGFGIWATAITYPRRFAAIAPICGGGSPYMAERIAHLPTWVFHGAKDPIVPLYESQRMVDALKSVGGDVRFTVYPDGEHDVWTRAYNNPELYDWMLAQRRR